MTKRTWTAAQLAAITQQKKNILVSAAAGSGKTAVLVERIIRRITDPHHPTDIDRLLVVTFTNAAANEMRERIGAAIAEALSSAPHSEHLRRQLALVGKADITTMHAFCLNVVRSHFGELGLDPGFRVADVTEAELIRLEALTEVVDEMYEDPDFADGFACLVEGYTNPKNEQSLYDLVVRCYEMMRCQPNPAAWLAEKVEMLRLPQGVAFVDTTLCMQLMAYAKEVLSACLKQLDEALAVAAGEPGLAKVMAYLASVRAEVEAAAAQTDFWAMQDAVCAIAWGRLPVAGKGVDMAKKQHVVALRDDVKAALSALVAEVFGLCPDDCATVLGGVYAPMRCLAELTLRLDARYVAKKRDKSILHSDDFEQSCLRILLDETGSPSSAAQEIATQYDEILIDEYQDTSRVQEAIFTAIARGDNLFMVGDLKQSIYRFRNTDPSLFREKKQTYAVDGAHNRKIVLGNNFRSAPAILQAINVIFERVMSERVGELTYGEEDRLYPGLAYAEPENAIVRDGTVCLIETDVEGDEEEHPVKMEQEAIWTANQIQTLVASKCQILGKDGYRPISYRDIVVLFRATKGWSDVFGRVFADAGIPCYADSGTGFFVTSEVRTVLSLLQVIDNPDQDIPLVAVLRSPIFGLATDELADIRLAYPGGSYYAALCKRAETADALGAQIREILEKLEEYRAAARVLRLDELLWQLYTDTGFYEFQGTQRGGELRQANLRTLLARAASFEKTSFRGLYSFIRFIDRFRAGGGDFGTAKNIGDEHDVVRIMSIHKSKGLEFPVVFLCGIGKRFNLRDLGESVLLDPDLGFGPNYVDPALRITCGTPMRTLIRQKQRREALSEELRILYVALTRAREKLILVGTVQGLDKKIPKWTAGGEQVDPARVEQAGSYLDWVGMALLTHPGFGALRARSGMDIPELPDPAPWHLVLEAPQSAEGMADGADEAPDAAFDETLANQLRESFAYQYPWQKLHQMPTKVTVTELTKLSQPDADSAYLYPKPAFLQRSGMVSASIGIAYHTALQRMDLHTNDIAGELDRLQDAGYLSPEEREHIATERLAALLASDLGQRIRRADRVEREVLFGIHVDAGSLFAETEAAGEQIMLQGVMDCLFWEHDEIYLVDYKTGRYRSAAEVTARYGAQLAYYALAVERMYGRRPAGKYLYMLDGDETIPVV